MAPTLFFICTAMPLNRDRVHSDSKFWREHTQKQGNHYPKIGVLVKNSFKQFLH